MIKSAITLLLIAVSTIGFSQTIEEEVMPFNKVLIGPGINIELIKSDEEKIHLVSDSELIHDLFIDVEKGELKIYFDYKNFSFEDDNSPAHGKYSLENTPYEHIEVYGKIYFTHLDGIDFRGEEKLFSKDKFDTDEFELKVFGASEVKLANITAFNLRLKAFGESEISILGGSVDDMKITTYGVNEIHTSELKVDELKINSIGESELEVYATNFLKVKVIGEGSVYYAGDPKVKEFNIGEATVSRIY